MIIYHGVPSVKLFHGQKWILYVEFHSCCIRKCWRYAQIHLQYGQLYIGCPKKTPRLFDCVELLFCSDFQSEIFRNLNWTCFTHEYKLSLKLINQEQNGITLKLLPPFRKFRMHANGAHNHPLLQSHNFNTLNW